MAKTKRRHLSIGKRATTAWFVLVLVLPVAFLISCSKDPAAGKPVAEGNARDRANQTVDVLPFDPANGSFQGFDDIDSPVQLESGVWQGPPWVEGSAARPEIQLLARSRVEGDLNGDGLDEQALLLNMSMGGTGQLLYLAVIPPDTNAEAMVPVMLVGDRPQIRKLRIDDGHVRLDVLQAGIEDAMCCPGELASRLWSFDDSVGLLELESDIPVERFSAASLQDTSWKLQRWNRQEVATDSGVTMEFADGAISGSSGCNGYRASIADGAFPGAVSIGPAMGTKMACPEEKMAAETRFLQALPQVTKVGFLSSQLALTVISETGVSVMLFDRIEQAQQASD